MTQDVWIVWNMKNTAQGCLPRVKSLKRPTLHTSLTLCTSLVMGNTYFWVWSMQQHASIGTHYVQKFDLKCLCHKLFAFACEHSPNSLHLNSLILNFQVHAFKNCCGSVGLTLLAIFLQLKLSTETCHKSKGLWEISA